MNDTVILFLLSLLAGLNLVRCCNITGIARCFQQLNDALGLSQDNLGTELFEVINPNLDSQQTETCPKVNSIDFTPIRLCVNQTGCGSQEILPYDIASQPSTPLITWDSIVDMLIGLCKPGCEDLLQKSTQVQICNEESQENLGCRGLEKLYKCFRGAIGTCYVLVEFTESYLTNMGITKEVQNKCPKVDQSLRSSSASTYSISLVQVLMTAAIYTSLNHL